MQSGNMPLLFQREPDSFQVRVTEIAPVEPHLAGVLLPLPARCWTIDLEAQDCVLLYPASHHHVISGTANCTYTP
jgi:hypothetical protein